MDIYSNILFVMEEHAELAILAQEACEIDKYRPESCCVIGKIFFVIRSFQTGLEIFIQKSNKFEERNNGT